MMIALYRFNSRFVFRERTALHWSSKGGHVDVCQFLVASKADINTKEERYYGFYYMDTLELAVKIFSICFER